MAKTGTKTPTIFIACCIAFFAGRLMGHEGPEQRGPGERTNATTPGYIFFPSDVDWVTRKSAHFEVIYRRGFDRLGWRVLQSAERAHELLQQIFPPGPDRPRTIDQTFPSGGGMTRIVLADFMSAMNGYAINFPWPHIVLFVTPPDPQAQLADLGDWLDSLVLHEYVHTRHIWPVNGLWKVAKILFGSIILPNGLMPSHFHEGMATLLETELLERGRGTGSHFTAIRRMAVKAGKWNLAEFGKLDRMDGGVSFWPQGVAPYFFGYQLHKEIWDRRGREGLKELTLSFSDNWPYFLTVPFKETYGLGIEDLWHNIFDKTREWEKQEIARIEQEPLSELEFLTESGFRKWDVAVSPDGKQLAYRDRHPDRLTRIRIRRTDGTESALDEEAPEADGSPSGLFWVTREKGAELVYLERKVTNSRNYLVPKFASVSGSQSPKLPSSMAVQSMAPSSNLENLVGYSEWGGQGKLVWWKISEKTPEKSPEKSPEKIGEWDLPEGAWVTSILSGEKPWFTLREGSHTTFYTWPGPTQTPQARFSVRGHAFNLREGVPGELLAIAEFDQRREIYAFYPSKNTFRKRAAFLGGVNAFDVSRDGDTDKLTLFASVYQHGGYDIAKVSWVQHPEQNLQSVKPTSTVIEKKTFAVGGVKDYQPLNTLFPQTWIPNILVVPDGVQIGVFVPGFDIAQKHSYQLYGGYDSRGLPFASATYQYRFGAKYSLVAAPFFSPSYIQSQKAFFKQWGASLGISSRLEDLRLNWSVSPIFKRVESSALGPALQSVGLSVSASRSWNFRSKPGGVAPVSGTSVSVSHAQYFRELGSDDAYYRTRLGVDQYVEAPWWEKHVFQFRLRAGMTEGTELYNSFLEGGGELLFYQARSYFINRGFLPGSFFGRRMASLNVEYKFPILRIERGYNTLPIFLSRLSGELVADVLTFESPSRRFKAFNHYFGSVGAVLSTRWKFLYYVPTTLRLGAYHGFGQFGEDFYLTLGIFASI